MITKGSKIELVKPMGAFDNIGEVCEVTNVTEDGVISFRFGGCHLGCMSYNECEKYFKHYKPIKKREWTGWAMRTMEYCRLDSRLVPVIYHYRYNNKQIQIRTNRYNAKIECHTSCNKCDEFSLKKGLELAEKRLKLKLLQAELNDFTDKM